MIMDLPARYRLKSFARVKGKDLLIFRSTRFEDLMYSITYTLRKRVCIYCNKVMHAKGCSLDHRYPIDIGGISITNNLFPACPDCNSQKSNLTHAEYLMFMKLSDSAKKEYRQHVEEKNENIRKAIGFRLPSEWITYKLIQEVMYHKQVVELHGLRYTKTTEHYSKYGTFPRPIVVDRDFRLLDGYNIVFFAREHRIQYLPVIWLENVLYPTKRQTYVTFDS